MIRKNQCLGDFLPKNILRLRINRASSAEEIIKKLKQLARFLCDWPVYELAQR